MRQHVSAFKAVIAGDGARRAKDDHSDESLVIRVAAGNRLAMQALFARHHPQVYRFLLRLVGSEATAEDLTSDVFLCLWQQASRFQARSSFSTWLLALARNKALSELRRRAEVADPGEQTEMVEPSDDPEVSWTVKRRREMLRHCLTRLSPEHREIIDLVYYHDKSVQEVAEIVHVPRNTVKTRMFHARRKLSQLLAAQGLKRRCL